MLLKNISAATERFLQSPWAVLAVVCIAVLLRLCHLSDWSLFEDEETSIYFSQHVAKPFPRSFPVFFVALRGLYHLTGISIYAGRLVAAGMGIVAVWLTFSCFRHLLSREVALVAALFVAVNLGHLFWSQSIRYYTTVTVFQLVAAYWFLKGFESGQPRYLIYSNAAFVLALLSHYSAVLLAPVFVGFLVLVHFRKEAQGGYHWRGFLIYGAGLALTLAFLSLSFWQQLQLQGSLGEDGGIIASAREPLQLLLRVAAYFGLPVFALAVPALFLRHKFSSRIVLFLLLLGFVPLIELTAITVVNSFMNLVTVSWYYALISLSALALLAASTLVALFNSGVKRTAIALGVLTVAYYGFFLQDYYTAMHGDRPRWREASELVQRMAAVDPYASVNPAIFATVPGVVAYYLGVDPATTMGHSLVKRPPIVPDSEMGNGEPGWFIVKAKAVSSEWQDWFAQHAALVGRFAARTGPRDRTLLVYRTQ